MTSTDGFTNTNEALLKRVSEVIPGGVNSPVRAFTAVGGTPYFVDHAQGAYVWDVEGRRYTDYVQSYGAFILGHANADVVVAIRNAASNGTSYGAPTEREVLLAEAICDRVAGCDMVRLMSTGTEAAMSAVRLARGYTKRDRIIKFAGCYHGHSDMLLAAGGSGIATLGVPDSAGVPVVAVADTTVAPYNEVPVIGDDVACVIVEPIAANMGVVPPQRGFLQGLRKACDESGALLIFDEVITGFRVSRGGASELTGVRPDLWCFGKVIGGGLPLAAVGGRREVMERFAPTGPVYQAGTLSGNPLATAAGLAVLEQLDDSAYQMLSGRAAELGSMLKRVVSEAGLPIQVPVIGTLLGLFFSPSPVTNYDEAKASCNNGLYAKFFNAILQRGIAFPPGPYEALFPSLSHTWNDIERTVDIASAAVADVVS